MRETLQSLIGRLLSSNASRVKEVICHGTAPACGNLLDCAYHLCFCALVAACVPVPRIGLVCGVRKSPCAPGRFNLADSAREPCSKGCVTGPLSASTQHVAPYVRSRCRVHTGCEKRSHSAYDTECASRGDRCFTMVLVFGAIRAAYAFLMSSTKRSAMSRLKFCRTTTRISGIASAFGGSV